MEALALLAAPVLLLAAALLAAVLQTSVFVQSVGFRRRLRLDRRQLESLSSMKSKFLSMAVHDVRTPLASIKGFGEMLRGMSPDPRQTHYADNVVKSAEHIRRLMEDLTDLAMIEAGKLRMDMAAFDPGGMISDAVPAIELAARQKGVALTVRSSGLPPRIRGDRFRLTQALLNLLGNAVKFTPPGGRVELRAGLERGGLSILVKDSGQGVDASERARIFETFYQSRFSEAGSKRKGWGLGLAIAREIARAHRGEIGVESPGLGRGSTFWLRVPLAAALALLLPGLPRAQAPFAEKAAFERSLERKAEAVASRVLGAGRCRVSVDAALDFSRTERLEVKEAKPEPPAEPFRADSGEGVEPGELLPGIPMPESPSAPGLKSYEKRSSYPASFVRRLTVTVLLDKAVSVEQGDQLSRILSDVLDLQPGRGDVLNVLRAPFMPGRMGKELLLRYAFLSVLALSSLLVVAIGLFKVAGAMDAMAKAQHLVPEAALSVAAIPAPVGSAPPEPAPLPPPEPEPEPAPDKPLFEVRPEKADDLVRLLWGQDPENVAFVAARLPPETREAFLSRLPEPVRSQAARHLDDAPAVDPALESQVKEELERRLGALAA